MYRRQKRAEKKRGS